MPGKRIRQEEHDALVRDLRERVKAGAHPPLVNLKPEDLAAANELIANGEAIIDDAACRLFLAAKKN